MKKIFLKAILDGLMQSFIFAFLGVFLFSAYASHLSLEQHLLAGALCATVSAAMCVLLAKQELSNKGIVCFFITNIFCFLICTVIMIAIISARPIVCFPLRETNYADGILLLFAYGSFILVSFVLRGVILGMLIIRCTRAKHSK